MHALSRCPCASPSFGMTPTFQKKKKKKNQKICQKILKSRCHTKEGRVRPCAPVLLLVEWRRRTRGILDPLFLDLDRTGVVDINKVPDLNVARWGT